MQFAVKVIIIWLLHEIVNNIVMMKEETYRVPEFSSSILGWFILTFMWRWRAQQKQQRFWGIVIKSVTKTSDVSIFIK